MSDYYTSCHATIYQYLHNQSFMHLPLLHNQPIGYSNLTTIKITYLYPKQRQTFETNHVFPLHVSGKSVNGATAIGREGNNYFNNVPSIGAFDLNTYQKTIQLYKMHDKVCQQWITIHRVTSRWYRDKDILTGAGNALR